MSALSRNFDHWGDEAKFDWLYLRNPYGPARVWFLEDATGKVVGLSGAFPRKLRTGERELNAWLLGDFCVEKGLRALGPAIALQRAVCEGVDRGEADVWYDFPSRSMSAVYGRMGLQPSGALVRWVRPLRVDGQGLFAKSLAFVGTSFLFARDLLEWPEHSIDVELHVHGFEALGELRTEENRLQIDRSPVYLDWKYRSDPQGPASVLLARREGVVAGGIVFRKQENKFAIVDLIGVRQEAVFRELVRRVVRIARSQEADRVVCSLTTDHPGTPVLAGLGFARRESAPVFAYTRRDALDPLLRWALTSGDRDV